MGCYGMKKQCAGCFKRFEVIRDTSVPVTPDLRAPMEHIHCPWCGCENGAVEAGSLISTKRCVAESEF